MQSTQFHEKQPVPVFLLTGFLGSGKTTILRGLLRLETMRNTAVVVNEFGEIGLDHLLVESRDGDVVLLSGGCLCCAVSDTLADTLADLASRRVAGTLPAFDRVIIETTGLADPGPIIRNLEDSSLIRSVYVFSGVVATVDALFGEEQIARNVEVKKQIAVADRLLLTKTDVVDANAIRSLRHRIRQINPVADIVQIVNGEIRAIEFFEARSRALPHDFVQAVDKVAAAHDHAGAHGDGVRAISLVIDHPISWAGYAAWVDLLKQLPAQSLLRVKGILHVVESDSPFVIQGVQHYFSKPAVLRDVDQLVRSSRIVVITMGIRAGIIEKTVVALQAEPGSQARVTLRDIGESPQGVVECADAPDRIGSMVGQGSSWRI